MHFAALTFGVSNVDVRISTKNHRLWRAFCRTYLRRVEILMLAFRRKTIDFGVLFAALTFGVSKFRCSHFDEKSSILACFLLHLPSAFRNSDKKHYSLNIIFFDTALAYYIESIIFFHSRHSIVRGPGASQRKAQGWAATPARNRKHMAL